MVGKLRSIMQGFPDKRTGSNTVYPMEDVGMGAFAVFFTQSPSFLQFQRDMDKKLGKSNAQSLLQMGAIPCDNHIRDLLDEVPPAEVLPMFGYLVDGLEASGHLETYRSVNGTLLVGLDGTEHHSSKKIDCKQCNTKQHRNGEVTYSHTVITPVVVAPGNDTVIPLEPAFVVPQDGHEKQDCENAAAKRWLRQYGKRYRELGVTILGDDLYCRQPVCEVILDEQLNFILVCQPESHQTLYEWVEGLEVSGGVQTVTAKRWTGKTHETDTYRFVNQVPLRDGAEALLVNWCELITTGAEGKVLYQNAFTTGYDISKANVVEIASAGRARWKVENENNNVLKTKGYHLEHNFGHGEKYLSSVLVALNLLAFLFHVVLGLMDSRYQLVRQALGARQTFFDDIRALTRYLFFESWEALLCFMMRGLELEGAEIT
jgi:hypothetical protein